MKRNLNSFTIIVVLLFLSSCVSREKIVYLQEKEGVSINENIHVFEPTLQIGDILNINVSTIDSESSVPFNLYETASLSNPKPLTYLVNADGKINFPVLGDIKVAGFTTKEVTKELTNKLKEGYLKNPIVNLRLKNFKITVMGAVKNPGTFIVDNERISIVEAIGRAGDLDIKGKRNDIKLIREKDGERKIVTIDLTSQELFDSPYYYLSQNDIIIVEPNQSQRNSSIVGANTSIIFSAIASIISIIALIIR